MNIGMMYQKSNEPTKTKKAMKTKKFLSMAALALVGAMMTGCSSDDDILQPENKTNVVTLTATVGFDASAGTRALTSTGVKTFAEGDKMAVIYKNTSGNTVKAEGTITSGAGTKSGTFTFTLTNPDKTQNVTYIYPAAMAGSTGVDYTKLNSQSNGTLTDLGSKYDLATNSGAWNGDNLPTLTLENQLAILAINLKNSTGTSDITGDIRDMTISDGTNTYAVSRSAVAGPIYVAIRPTSSATISITATDGTNEYGKTLATTKTYAAGNGYNVTWNMSVTPEYYNKLTKINDNFSDQRYLLKMFGRGRQAYNSSLTAAQAYALATYQASIDGRPVYVIMSSLDDGYEIHYAVSTDASATEHTAGLYDLCSESNTVRMYYVAQ